VACSLRENPRINEEKALHCLENCFPFPSKAGQLCRSECCIKMKKLTKGKRVKSIGLEVMPMVLDENDKAIIAQALRVAVLNSTDYEEITLYEGLLHKLSWKNGSQRSMNTDDLDMDKYKDGFRYDYDDSSDLM
jgi:hypothetical protein